MSGQMTLDEEKLAELAAPFPKESIRWVPKAGGMQAAYITARTAMNRLDEVIGPAHWFDEYAQFGENGVLCKLYVRFADSSGFICKCGIGGHAGMSDAEDDEKSAESSAFKRAAVKFGVGRYLYRDGVPSFCGDCPPPEPGNGGLRPAAPSKFTRNGPAAAPPAGEPEMPRQPAARTAPSQPRGGNGQGGYDNFQLPRAVKGLFPWTKALGEHYGVDLLDGVSKAGAAIGAPRKWGEWTMEQVQEVALRAIMYIKTLDNYDGKFDHIDTNPEGE